MAESLEALASSLLYEGYCLYPYTPGAVKNSTPTPFGIVYPPAYARRNRSTFDHLQVECILEAGADATLEAAAVFLQARGEGHQAEARRVQCAVATVADRGTEAGEEVPFDFEAEGDDGVAGRLLLSATSLGQDLWRIQFRVENLTEVSDAAAGAMDRRQALERSLLSTHALLEVRGGRFVSPLGVAPWEAAIAACRNVNTWPVLAASDDSAILGAAIFLPDHPRIAPESRVNFFDNTEIEEALVLHVQTLSDAEREAIGSQDPAVRAMIDRALATSPEELSRLHGVMRPVETASPAESENLAYMTRSRGEEAVPGERQISVGGVIFRLGGKVVLRLGARADPYERLLDGRTATVERLYYDYDDRAYLGVTIDGEEGQELLRDTGRFHYFFAHEAEVIGQ